jgi:hypothetical protein
MKRYSQTQIYASEFEGKTNLLKYLYLKVFSFSNPQGIFPLKRMLR